MSAAGTDHDAARTSVQPLDPAAWAEYLRAHGLRATAGRLAAIIFIDSHPHVSAAEIFAELRRQLPTTSPQAVHNIVHDLHSHDLLRRIDLPDSDSARYETRIHDNHHHVQCVMCGRIEDVDCVVGHAPCMTPLQDHGMRIFETDVTFRGICESCQEKERSDHE